MKELRRARAILGILLKDSVRYPKRLIFDALTILVRCVLLFVLYSFVFQLNGGSILGIDFPTAAWSMFMYFSLMVLRLRDISKFIMKDVQSGQVEILLTKPISYLSYRMWWQIGVSLYPFLVLTLCGVTVMIAWVGIPQTMTVSMFLPSLFVVFIGGVLLSLVLYSMVGLAAFWIEDATPLHWIVDKAVMMLGGSYLPVALFPPLMYAIARYSPFGASQFVSHTVNPNWQYEWLMLFGIQMAWIIVLTLLLGWMFHGARTKVSINGG